MESGTKKRSNSPRNISQCLGLAVASAALLPFSHITFADDVYDGAASSVATGPYIDGGDFLAPNNWDLSAASPTPNNVLPSSAQTTTIGANTGFVGASDGTLTIDGGAVLDTVTTAGGGAAQGAVFDPTGFGDSTSTLTLTTLYLSSTSGEIGTSNSPNVLTIKSGTLESTPSTSVIVGRDSIAQLNQTGGTFAADVTMQLGQSHSNGPENGILNWDGGTFLAGVTTGGTYGTASGSGLRTGTASGSLGIIEIHTPSTPSVNNKLNLDNLYFGYASGGLGVLQDNYENGGVSTINITGPAASSEGQLAIRNYAATPTFGTGADGSGGTIGAVLDLQLNAAPTIIGGAPQNLALITYTDGIHGQSTFDKDFFSPTGTDLTEGSQVTATYGGTTYAWDIYYDGSINGAISSEISSANVLQTGGSLTGVGAVVLIGVPVPEPTATAMLVLGGVALLGKRLHRRSTI